MVNVLIILVLHRLCVAINDLVKRTRFSEEKNIYTERQKKTYHFFRATLTKIYSIKINHIWTQISYSFPHEAHLKTSNGCFCQKEKKCCEIAIRHFLKSQKLLAEDLPERPPIQNIQWLFIRFHSMTLATLCQNMFYF